ncbi:MAG: hypothetical protein IT364_23520 [Candidatus Hydrogenedentes bacterium]|nr:hypothetical protein [Candidatus Hydrogenedentota bacterium]
MKHHRIISRRPAVATTALASKIEFKTTISSVNAEFIPLFTGNVAEVVGGLFQNALNLGTFVTVVIEEFVFGGGDDGGAGV